MTDDVFARVRRAGLCAQPVNSEPWPTACCRPPLHKGACMDERTDCVWCSGVLVPWGTGGQEPVQTRGGAWFHKACRAAMYQERRGTVAA